MCSDGPSWDYCGVGGNEIESKHEEYRHGKTLSWQKTRSTLRTTLFRPMVTLSNRGKNPLPKIYLPFPEWRGVLYRAEGKKQQQRNRIRSCGPVFFVLWVGFVTSGVDPSHAEVPFRIRKKWCSEVRFAVYKKERSGR